MKDLTDRVAVVTGAAGGLGRALAVELARAGAHVAVADIRPGPIAETADAVRAQGRHASAHVLDVADESAWPGFVDAVLSEHGAADIVVNNAGVALLGNFADIEPADARWQIDVNFWGVYNGCHFFLPHLLTRPRAHIINISSLFGLIGVPQNSLYCASKFAVRGLTESLISELADTSVRLTCVHPGAVATDIAKDARMPGDGMSRRRGEKVIAAGVTPDAAAATIVSGMRARRERVLVGRDARLMDRIVRIAPTGHRRLVRAVAGRIRGRNR
ncbi:MAG: NAD(P)-dependent dehydrogenase (short-subunit alcohol dehydrogenase family) [Myxococcota bacterium]|jgi:NAD(P)-dependent dehydrogenase (short-subunit alcohol dehydrogenase family)